MIQQMWPYIGDFVKNLLKTSVEAAVNANLPDKMKPFHFEKIDLGDIVSCSVLCFFFSLYSILPIGFYAVLHSGESALDSHPYCM